MVYLVVTPFVYTGEFFTLFLKIYTKKLPSSLDNAYTILYLYIVNQ